MQLFLLISTEAMFGPEIIIIRTEIATTSYFHNHQIKYGRNQGEYTSTSQCNAWNIWLNFARTKFTSNENASF